MYAPIHVAAARGQGLFFLVLGFTQVGWGAVILRHPSPRSYLVGMTIATVMPAIVYALTRFIAPPFSDEAESVDIIGSATFLGEALGFVLLAWHGLRQGIQWRSPDVAPAALAALLLVGGLFAAGAALGVGMALESMVPWLAEGEATGEGGTGGHHAETDGGRGNLARPLLTLVEPGKTMPPVQARFLAWNAVSTFP
ncbi:MAG: hypothetical protein ACYC2H_00770 [Thermoplasmatota archaeon]